MDAEVYWSGRRVGLLRGVRVDQPYYLGEWVPAADSEFTAALLAWMPTKKKKPNRTAAASPGFRVNSRIRRSYSGLSMHRFPPR